MQFLFDSYLYRFTNGNQVARCGIKDFVTPTTYTKIILTEIYFKEKKL